MSGDELIPPLYTLHSANAALMEVGPLVMNLVAIHNRVKEAQAALEMISPTERSNGHQMNALHLEQIIGEGIAEMAVGLGTLESLGISVKDLETGIIDFPTEHEGRLVLLCWRLGETEIGYWHELDTGFTGRRPVSELNPRG